MLGSFRVRLLVVIVIVTLAGLSMQSGRNSRDIVEPVINYVLKDYGIQDKLATYTSQFRENQGSETLPAASSQTLQLPCAFDEIEQKYGWYWNQEARRQEFFPAVIVKVEMNSVVKPVMDGTVADIKKDDRGRTVLIDHGGGLLSSYGGLQEVLVEVGKPVKQNDTLGKTGDKLYFQMTSENEPLNPNTLFE